MARIESKNPFYTESEDDDFGFGRSGPAYGQNRDPFADDVEPERPLSRYEQLQKQKEASMVRQLQGTQRALASINDSEQMGVATAEELVNQGEQLDNVEKNLDKINTDMKTSQRHLNSIKSVFGSFKNWMSGKDKAKEEAPPVTSIPKEKGPTGLQKSLEDSYKKSGEHPAYRVRGTGGFYEDDNLDDMDSKFLAGGSSGRDYSRPGDGRENGHQSSQSTQRTVKSGFSEYDKQFDNNLVMMSSGMEKLKGLAMGLGDEIERQNDQLDRIDDKTDKADLRLRDQNRQMRHILKK